MYDDPLNDYNIEHIINKYDMDLGDIISLRSMSKKCEEPVSVNDFATHVSTEGVYDNEIGAYGDFVRSYTGKRYELWKFKGKNFDRYYIKDCTFPPPEWLRNDNDELISFYNENEAIIYISSLIGKD